LVQAESWVDGQLQTVLLDDCDHGTLLLFSAIARVS
jgi:hypothetical protein